MLVVQNTPSGGPGRVGDGLREAGLDLEVVQAHAGEPLPRLLGRRALLVLGGGYLPGEDERAPWLPAVRRLTAQALEDGRPMLGICLGGQLLAEVAGGRVRGRYGPPEFGSTPIRMRPEAGADPLFGPLPAVAPAIERHVDAITELPPDAVWLADSERCPHQAFRVGDAAWGVQFHPEVPAGRIGAWAPGPLREQGYDRDELLRRALAAEPAASAAWTAFTARFAAAVAGSGARTEAPNAPRARPGAP
ncbi:type 1 glutamine amidotransferase [Streptomyces triticagri]|uniref:Type 1 glutamine amidotransferase n=1 Tax=Streptomyces triticagri TaxID=2293568 RepID=A0A372M1U2_9ACTN|nr:type 1 glutamine amidotransferase [Streptomyces triticagri]RFU84861.1 type 1 glutamine amidotransferase [Streptomyces triticagri]